MDYSVKLERLPETIVFPPRLKDRVSFDGARGELAYRGFMTKCAYDELSDLSDDPEYHRALEQLFVRTSAEVTAPPRQRLPAILVATAGAVAVALAALWITMRRPATIEPTAPTPAIMVSTAAR